jgi:hypothetical protein
MPVSDALEAVCWREARRLERFGDRIAHCRVVIARRKNSCVDRAFDVSMDLVLAGGKAPWSPDARLRCEAGDLEAAIRGLFEDACRRLEGRFSAATRCSGPDG